MHQTVLIKVEISEQCISVIFRLCKAYLTSRDCMLSHFILVMRCISFFGDSSRVMPILRLLEEACCCNPLLLMESLPSVVWK